MSENIWPEEIEAVIAGMPGVEQVAVIGVPSDQWGQEVCAYVVTDPGVTLQVCSSTAEHTSPATKCPSVYS
ncbi:MAG TPA: hypothetical protein VFA63_16630 [Pseudonocardiaceae bacterium]|nr:hypothetical protein [Pseudonocardiaceae bacterium]